MAGELAELLSGFRLNNNDATETAQSGVRFFKITEHAERTPMVYDPGLYIIAQGQKIGYLGKDTFIYNEDNYLVNLVSIPFECETWGSKDVPLLGIYIEINIEQLFNIVEKMELRPVASSGKPRGANRGMGPARLDTEMKDAVCRLVKCLRSEKDTRILGQALVSEVIYRALSGEQASALLSLTTPNSDFSNISGVLRYMEASYSEKLDVDQLAALASMSPSKFHKAFKQVTSESPVQYLKKIRLNKARYMMQGGTKAYIAAYRVGYESPSQFSREFKRYFGYNPADVFHE